MVVESAPRRQAEQDRPFRVLVDCQRRQPGEFSRSALCSLRSALALHERDRGHHHRRNHRCGEHANDTMSAAAAAARSCSTFVLLVDGQRIGPVRERIQSAAHASVLQAAAADKAGIAVGVDPLVGRQFQARRASRSSRASSIQPLRRSHS